MIRSYGKAAALACLALAVMLSLATCGKSSSSQGARRVVRRQPAR